MSDGSVHARDSFFCAVASGAIGTIFLGPKLGLTCGLGALSGIVLTPDLDQEGISKSEWQIVKLTAGVGFLWVGFWYPYAMMTKHRGISHQPFVGTLTRVLYSLLVLVPLLAVLDSLDFLLSLSFCAMVAGLMVSDTMHWIRDNWGS